MRGTKLLCPAAAAAALCLSTRCQAWVAVAPPARQQHRCTMTGAPTSTSGASSAPPSATKTIILGSKSSTRKLIIEEMGFHPIIRTADIDEKAIGDRNAGDPEALVLEIGTAKADALLPSLSDVAARAGARLLLTGDQVVVHDGRILEKPADLDEVRRNIDGYARSPCQTVGSAVLTDLATGRRARGVDTATIFFRKIPGDVVDALCAEGDVLWCAGGLMIEHALVQPYIERIDGTLDSVMGLSKPLVQRLLEELDAADARAAAAAAAAAEVA